MLDGTTTELLRAKGQCLSRCVIERFRSSDAKACCVGLEQANGGVL